LPDVPVDEFFCERFNAPYLPAQIVTTILIMFVTSSPTGLWTFAQRAF